MVSATPPATTQASADRSACSGSWREREAGRVAERSTQRRERREDVQDPGWVEQQEVAVWDEPMQPGDRRAEIDGVVVVDDAIEPTAAKDGQQPDGERQRGDRRDDRRRPACKCGAPSGATRRSKRGSHRRRITAR